MYETEIKKVNTLDSLRDCSVFSYGKNDLERRIPYSMSHTYGEWERLYRRHSDIEMYWKKGNDLEDISILLNLDYDRLLVYSRVYFDQFQQRWLEPWKPPVISDNLD